MQYGNNVWHTVNYNSRLQPYQALDIINNENDKLLRAECLYWGGSYDLTACGATNHTDNNGNPRATVFWYGNGGTSVSASFNETFAYDGVNRLTGVVDNGGWSRYFAYDQYSNMWLCGWPGIAPNGAAPAATYCSKTPSELFDTANQIIGRSYDGAGNMASLMGSNFSYDAENRITTAVQPGIGTVTYTYDGDGRRVMKAVSTGLQTVYVYDIGGKLVAEYSSGAVSVPPCHTCFLSTDHLGSTRLVTDENGNTVSRHDYIPFGEEIQANSGGRDGTFGAQDFVNQKFTGKERDQETGLDYFGARYYGSALGRFTSPDEFKGGFDNLNGQPAFSPGPIGYADLSDPQTLNMYVYTRNNPLRYTDPDGHDFLDYLSGVANAFVSDNAAGAGRAQGGNQDFQLGQTVGDGVATVTGAVETLGGIGGEIGGTLLDATGVGALIGVPAQVVSAGAVVHGGTTAAEGAVNLFKAGGRFLIWHEARCQRSRRKGNARTAESRLRRDRNPRRE
jgi:RHS repeat-associated protein